MNPYFTQRRMLNSTLIFHIQCPIWVKFSLHTMQFTFLIFATTGAGNSQLFKIKLHLRKYPKTLRYPEEIFDQVCMQSAQFQIFFLQLVTKPQARQPRNQTQNYVQVAYKEPFLRTLVKLDLVLCKPGMNKKQDKIRQQTAVVPKI